MASTKAFTTQLAALFLLAATLAKINGRLSPEDESGHLTSLRHLPLAVQKVLALEAQIREWAGRFAGKQHALFLGRGRHYPIALRGGRSSSRKFPIFTPKPILRVSSSMALALVDSEMPVISVAPNDMLLEKMKSNLKNWARGGELYVFADADSAVAEIDGVHIMRLPEHYGLLSRCCMLWFCGCWPTTLRWSRGRTWTNRNLAKSVTVE